MEDWEDGFAFKELEIKRQNLTTKKDKLESKRKELTKSKNLLKQKLPAPGQPENNELREYNELLLSEDVLRQQVSILKREESDLSLQFEQLTFERNLHRKQCKLLYDQEKSQFNHHPLLHHRYVLENLLGCGGFSEVYAAFDLIEEKTVACKIHQINSSWSKQKKENYQKHALREYRILEQVSNERVVNLFDVFKLDETSFCTILEYCNDGDLDSRLKERNKLSEKETKYILAQIIEGLKYLNKLSNPIIHYDLKPGNILFHHGEVKLTDFGLSKVVENSNDGKVDLTSMGAGTYAYLPPECFDYSKPNVSISSKVLLIKK